MADLSRDEIWDDSSLIDTWNHALQEYKKYHSINTKKDLQKTKNAADTPSRNIGGEAFNSAPSNNNGQHKGKILNYDEEQMDEVIEQKDDETPTKNDIEPEVKISAAQGHPSTSSMPPPPPPFAFESNDEALKNLMMSWYYAGYYTGLYEGHQKAAQGKSD